MKSLLLVFCLVLFTWSVPVQAARLCSAPPDTVAGEARLTALFARGICEQVALESRHQDFTVLTQEQGMALLQDMLSAVVMRDSSEFKAFVSHAPDATAAVQRVSIQAVLRLASACPAASKLLVKMGIQMTSMDTTLTTAQQQAVNISALDICKQLAVADVAQPLSQRPAAERIVLYHEAVQRMLHSQHSALTAAFGDAVLTNAQLENKLWLNIDRLMFDQCPAVTGIIRVDLGIERMRVQEAATAHSQTALQPVAAPSPRPPKSKPAPHR
ncbi:hypothetical protein [Hymenobacter siberiensis]|uniref:hypothetical protein n=1 Tax=Hymenobacter siberiensis TaxID=2848396 RepID=UPI001C1DDD5B|nr:hypothetical protein [Hymenobacter siberiensis]